jgi:hypothetical protein
VVAAVSACATAPHHPARPIPTTTTPAPAPTLAVAAPVPADPRVGALFLGAGSLHTCTAAVVDSTAGDLILTAAHCVADGFDTTFVPGFTDAAEAPDPWHVDAVYLDPRWTSANDPMADYAIARVSRASGGELSPGGGMTLGAAPGPGTVVAVTGYALGEGGGPIGCRAATTIAPGGFPSLPCAGLVAGVSGAPWVVDSTITGLVGGLDGGGCDENLSYSPPLDAAVQTLLQRAEQGGPGDTAPTAFDDGC